VYGSYLDEPKDIPALGLVDFYTLPHMDSKWFPNVRADIIKKHCEGMKEKIYALDDQSAIKIDGTKIEIVSEGKFLELN